MLFICLFIVNFSTVPDSKDKNDNFIILDVADDSVIPDAVSPKSFFIRRQCFPNARGLSHPSNRFIIQLEMILRLY